MTASFAQWAAGFGEASAGKDIFESDLVDVNVVADSAVLTNVDVGVDVGTAVETVLATGPGFAAADIDILGLIDVDVQTDVVTLQNLLIDVEIGGVAPPAFGAPQALGPQFLEGPEAFAPATPIDDVA